MCDIPVTASKCKKNFSNEYFTICFILYKTAVYLNIYFDKLLWKSDKL